MISVKVPGCNLLTAIIGRYCYLYITVLHLWAVP